MTKRVPKSRTIYNNYSLWETYPDDELREFFVEEGRVERIEDVTDDMMWNERYFYDECNWDNAKSELYNFFDRKTVGFFGNVGLWHGVYAAGEIGNFDDLFQRAIRDCDYISIYDENGHLYLHCSHHDGSHTFEIKEITEKGEEYLDNWEYNWDDKRTERYIHGMIFKRYSKLPRFAEKVYGCKAREYESLTKAKAIDMLNKEAKSFYS